MTFINEKIYQHKSLTNALLKLNDVLIRHDNPPDEKLAKDFEKMFSEVNSEDGRLIDKTIKGIVSSGNNYEVADELYNPSTDIFDINEQLGRKIVVDKQEQFEYPKIKYVDGSVRCTSVYRLRKGDRVCAEIKNYHTLLITDYTVTSLPYPILYEENFKSSGKIDDMKLSGNKFADRVESAGRFYSMSYPLTVIYKKGNAKEAITSTAQFYGVQTIETLKEIKKELDLISSRGIIFKMEYPLEVGYITYRNPPEKLRSTGFIKGMYYDWTP